MSPTTPERYAVVSCHVERPLDDRVWTAFTALQEHRPGGLSIATLLRPPDAAAGETDERLWLDRAREAAGRGPLGHHTHFTSPTHARPTGGPTGERVRREGAWLRERGVAPTLFCGGGWYTDRSVALACAELGYADCTPRATRPPYLDDGAAWVELATPALVDLGRQSVLVAVPTTHGAGDLARALVWPGLPAQVHAYFHDTDLVDRRRRALIVAGLTLLGRRRPVAELDAVASSVRGDGPGVPWDDVARGEAADTRT
jgi:hypothetical protein